MKIPSSGSTMLSCRAACTNRDRRDGSGSGGSPEQERDVPVREKNRSPQEARRRRPGDDRAGLDDLPRLQADGLDGHCGREIASPRLPRAGLRTPVPIHFLTKVKPRLTPYGPSQNLTPNADPEGSGKLVV